MEPLKVLFMDYKLLGTTKIFLACIERIAMLSSLANTSQQSVPSGRLKIYESTPFLLISNLWLGVSSESNVYYILGWVRLLVALQPSLLRQAYRYGMG